MTALEGRVVGVALRRGHHFSKTPAVSIRLLAGLGVEGDGHCGEKVKHRSRARFNPDLPNLRQVHLLPGELFDELSDRFGALGCGDLGENILTRGLDLAALPAGTRLSIGPDAVVELTGLRNPCVQIDGFREGLMAALIERAPDGAMVRKAGVMSVVIAGGDVAAGDGVAAHLPPQPYAPLKPV